MAYEPIVLGSNITGNYGALPGDPNYYIQESEEARKGMVENEDGTFTIPTYARETAVIPADFDWSQYGSKFAPMLRFYNSKQTGEFIYDPDEDKISEEEATALATEFETETGISYQEALKQEAIALGGQIAAGAGAQIGRAYAAGTETGIQGLQKAAQEYGGQKFGEFFVTPDTGATAKINFSKGTPKADIAIEKAKIKAADATPTAENMQAKQTAIDAKNAIEAANPDNLGYFTGVGDRLGFGGEEKKLSEAGRSNLYGSGGAAATTVAYNLINGKNLKESVKAGAKVGLGTYIGTAFGGGFGGMIGGLIGGRVICNELMRQGLLTRKEVLLDYRFTRDYLTPTHVNGYHVWAVWMVKQMRQGRFVPFWKHVAGHRANEIAHIYGERDKPDYLGKVYRKVLEPICWSIGFFCQKTDWSVLYKQKEI